MEVFLVIIEQKLEASRTEKNQACGFTNQNVYVLDGLHLSIGVELK